MKSSLPCMLLGVAASLEGCALPAGWTQPGSWFYRPQWCGTMRLLHQIDFLACAGSAHRLRCVPPNGGTQTETCNDFFVQGKFSGTNSVTLSPPNPFPLVCPLSSCLVLLRGFLLSLASASFSWPSVGLWHLRRSECGLCVHWTVLCPASQT